jgi:sulfur carrier protein ThiS
MIHVNVKLFASLATYAPPEIGPGQIFPVELPDKSNIAALMKELGIPEREVKVAFVNGRARADVYRLKEDDEVGIFPPVGGG